MSGVIVNAAEWQKERQKGIGASEASAILGLNPYMSNQELWRIKTGRKVIEDISNKTCVKYGHDAEPFIRELFALDYAERYEVRYGGAFDLVRNPENPFIFATLDGRLIESETGRRGVLEVKTSEILRSMAKEKWRDGVPDNYYTQLLHQLLATGWDFAVLHAQLKRVWDGEIVTSRRSYFIEREEVQDDLDYLLAEELKFWEYVQTDREPPLILPEI